MAFRASGQQPLPLADRSDPQLDSRVGLLSGLLGPGAGVPQPRYVDGKLTSARSRAHSARLRKAKYFEAVAYLCFRQRISSTSSRWSCEARTRLKMQARCWHPSCWLARNCRKASNWSLRRNISHVILRHHMSYAKPMSQYLMTKADHKDRSYEPLRQLIGFVPAVLRASFTLLPTKR